MPRNWHHERQGSMFPFWLILGSIITLLGIFIRQVLRWLGLKPPSEVFTTPSLKRSSKMIEQTGRWLTIILGLSFFVQGLGEALPGDAGSLLTSVLLGLAGFLLLAMFGIALVNWRVK
jgi:hypothetical protein